MTRILGIETSCDETAAAVVDDRCHVRSSVISSSIDVHREFGGVVPELAARHHVEAIGWVIRKALDDAGVTLESVDAVAVTRGPGLIGSLLVGFSAAKALAWQRDLPLLGINHLEGHVRSAFIEHPEIELPAIALVVSGGHTALYLCPREGEYRLLARTRDDAAGEAFDKVAKLLGLGYPGGPVIDRLSRGADDAAHRFPRAQMKDRSLDFSFSGIKTAVRRLAEQRGLDRGPIEEADASDEVRGVVASFQCAVVEVLVRRTVAMCRRESVRNVVVTGGVACNSRLREAFAKVSGEGLSVYVPSPRFTTDNAAMIAAAGFLHLEQGRITPLTAGADASWKLGEASQAGRSVKRP